MSVACQTSKNTQVKPPFNPAPGIPGRYSFAPTGSAFVKKIMNYSEYDREMAILKEIRRGNIPNFLRKFQPITVQTTLKTGVQVKATIWVSPDYLAIGSDKDFVRLPMNPVTAQWIADHFACVLPTVKIVDQIYGQAPIKLVPVPFKPSKKMVHTSQYVEHNEAINRQLARVKSQGRLVAGHKKDVVISNRLNRKKGKVAIYGWHRANGKAIQPLSTIHGNYYADYSHGIRLVAGMMLVNNILLPVAEVLQDPQLAPLLSYEGTIKWTRYATENAVKRKRWAPR